MLLFKRVIFPGNLHFLICTQSVHKIYVNLDTKLLIYHKWLDVLLTSMTSSSIIPSDHTSTLALHGTTVIEPAPDSNCPSRLTARAEAFLAPSQITSGAMYFGML